MFCQALSPLLADKQEALNQLNAISNEFPQAMQEVMIKMWSAKLGIQKFHLPLFNELMILMIKTEVDYTIFFRELSHFPEEITPLKKSFYINDNIDQSLIESWAQWLKNWKSHIQQTNSTEQSATTPQSRQNLTEQMKAINPKYTLREWHLVKAYQMASHGDYSLIKELQRVMSDPYAEQSKAVEEKYYKKRPLELIGVAGTAHLSCSS